MLLRVISFGLAFVFWQLLALTLPPSILPGPIETTVTLWENLAAGDVFEHLWITLLRVFGGLTLALAIAIPVGVLMGVHRTAEGILDIWVMVAMTIPSLCYALICFIWLGLNEFAAIVAIAVTAAPSIAINVWEGVKGIDVKLIQMARAYEAGRPQILTRVMMPQVMPYVMASLRFGLGIIWKITVFVELIGRPSGVGFKLFYWYQLADMKQVLAWTLLFTLVMLLIELVALKQLERYLFSWRPRIAA
ncbi:MAG: ABC transporter permease [Alphaproteobacteria bacterium]